MALPVNPATGLLAAGRHPATWTELEAVFVAGAPHTAERREVYQALRLWAGAAWKLFSSAVLWIDGGFVTHKTTAPFDADVVLVVAPAELANVIGAVQAEEAAFSAAVLSGAQLPKCPTSVRFWGLLTLQDVTSNMGVSVPRVQPFGGLVDAFIADASRPVDLAGWDDLWSQVPGDPSARKGFVEVRRT